MQKIREIFFLKFWDLQNFKKSQARREQKNYSISTSLFFRVQQIVSDKTDTVNEIEKENSLVSDKCDEIAFYISQAKSGLEALLEKLLHIKLPDRAATHKPTSPEEYLVELFSLVRNKVNVLMKGLKNYNFEDYKKRMIKEAVSVKEFMPKSFSFF